MLSTTTSRLILNNPRNLRSLHGLYESNYQRLVQLLGTAVEQKNKLVSRLPGDELALHLQVLERHRYTTNFQLTYWFAEGEERVADPNLEIRMYHDAKLAETYACGCNQHVSFLSHFDIEAEDILERRWHMNLMLNKWLEYLLEQGHRFS